MRALWREPLLHFLLLGALIFLAYEWRSGDRDGPDEITITRGQQQNLLNTFGRTWQRHPTAEEFQGLLRDYLREEIAYREARAMGLDENDVVIRRRLRQKLELLAEDVASLSPPTDAQLLEYLEAHPEEFRVEPQLTLRQVYFSPDRRGDRALQDAEQLLQRIRADGPAGQFERFGDPLPLPPRIDKLREGEIARLFGHVFTEGRQGLETGQWSGPVTSGFGLHLVFIEDRSEGRVPELAEVRAAVEREWLSQQRREAVDGLYDRLAENYSVEIESLVEPAEKPSP